MDRHDEADETDVPGDLDELFDALVLENGRVCSECFARLARRERYPDEPGYHYAAILTYVETIVPDDAKWNILEREYYERVKLTERTEYAYPPRTEPTGGGTTACRNCGSCTPQRTPQTTRSRQRAFDDARTLSETLEEYGVTHDSTTLTATVARLKRDPDMAGRDRDIYAQAVAESIRAALADEAGP